MAAAMWTDVDEVLAELGGGPYPQSDLDHIAVCAKVAHRQVARWRPDVDPSCGDVDIRLGAAKLAASHYRRRGGTGQEFAEFQDMAGYVNAVSYAEIQTLLGIGQHHAPVVA